MRKVLYIWAIAILLVVWTWFILPNKKARIAMQISNKQSAINHKQEKYDTKEAELNIVKKELETLQWELKQLNDEYTSENWGSAFGFQ